MSRPQRRARRLCPTLLALVFAASLAGCLDESEPPPAAVGPADARPPPPPALAVGQLRYLSPDRRADGDGSPGDPFGSPERAFAALGPADRLVLLAGDHGVLPPPPPGASLVGLGAEQTRLAGPLRLDAGQTLEAVRLDGPLHIGGGAALIGVTLGGGPAPIAQVEGPTAWTDVTLRGISAGPPPAEGPAPAAVEIGPAGALRWRGGGALDLACGAVATQGGQAALFALDLSAPEGIGVRQEGGRLEIADLRLSAPLGAGVLLLEADASLRGLTIVAPRVDPAQNTASGVSLVGGSALLEDSLIRGGDRAVRATAGARLTLRRLVSDQPLSDGLGLGDGASVEGEDLRIIAPRNVGVALNGAGTAGRLRQVEVLRPGRAGLFVAQGAAAHVEGLTVRDAVTRGVSIISAEAELRDIRIEDAGEIGLQITEASGPVRVVGAALRGCGSSGVSAIGAMPGGLHLEAITVEETSDLGDGLAIGVHLFESGATLVDLTARANRGPGLQVERSGADLAGGRLTGNGGPGAVILEATGEVRLAEVLAEANRGAGVLAIQSRVWLDAPRLIDNRADLGEGPGDGAAAFVQASLRVSGGASLDNAGSGLAASVGSALDLSGPIRLEGNAGFGIDIGCDGSTLTEDGAAEVAGNRRGARGGCP